MTVSTWDADLTKLTFTNDKAYDSADGTEMTTIDKVFKEGDKVVGSNDAGSAAIGTLTEDAVSNTMTVTTLDSLEWSSGKGQLGDTQSIVSDGNGVWVAVNDRNSPSIMYSIDNGESFQIATDIEDNAKDCRWNSVTYGDGKFILVGKSPSPKKQCAMSTDGIKWTTTGINLPLLNSGYGAVTYDGEKFVTVSAHEGSIYTSTNGLSWTRVTTLNLNDWKSIAYGDGTYVICRNNNTTSLMYSSNLTSWSEPDTPIAKNFYTIAFGDGVFVATGSGKIAYTDDPKSWQSFDTVDNNTWNSVAYGDNKFVFVKKSGTGKSSAWAKPTDITAFNLVETPEDIGWQAVAYGGNRFVSVNSTSNKDAVMYADNWGDDFLPGMTVTNKKEVTKNAPCGDDIVFTSSKPATTSGTVTTWGDAEWELTNKKTSAKETKSVTLKGNVDAEPGPTSFKLEDDTDYSVRVRYSSTTPAAGPSEWSDVNNFKTCSPKGGAYGNFSATLYPGSVSNVVVDAGIDLTEKGLIWIKCTSNSTAHHWVDSERDYYNNYLRSNSDSSERTGSNWIAPSSDGKFTITPGVVDISKDGSNYVAWSFAAAEGFFDVVTYKGTGLSGNTQSHSLNAEPAFVIFKCRSKSSKNWYVVHKANTSVDSNWLNNSLSLDLQNNTSKKIYFSDFTSTNFTITTDSDRVNGLDDDYVAYLFADNPDGGIKCGSYTTSPDTDVTVDVGFKPCWVLVKHVSKNNHWGVFNAKSGDGKYLIPGLMDNENGSSDDFKFTDTGFIAGYNSTITGNSGDPATEVIYVAIADSTALFYDENTNSTVTNHTLTRRYGVDPLDD